jgi:hypothetical protein
MTEAQVTAMTGAINFSTVLTGVAAAGAAIIVVLVAQRGVRMILKAVGGA